MRLGIGIVGLPNVGKTTLFNALTRAGANVAPYPFTTIEPNRGIVSLPDARLEQVGRLVRPQSVTPATVEFVDIAGLVRGAHRGEGLGNQFLGHIRNVDAVAVVCRCFASQDVAHVDGTVDPVRDLEVLELELILADLDVVERRLERVRSSAKARPREHADELDLLGALRGCLQQGVPASGWAARGDAQARLARELSLLSAKGRLYVANVDETDLPEGGALAADLRRALEDERVEVVVLSAQLESDLAEWDPEEALAYRASVQMDRSGLEALAWAGYRVLDLITFFTVEGGKEVRAWPIARGTQAASAAGRVHSQMEHGFIRAEVIHVDELIGAGSWGTARDQGIVRFEGRDYEVKDGDVCLFRFSA